jgi:hypothetical protein
MSTFGWGARFAGGLFASCCLAGCGIAVPDIKEVWDTDKEIQGKEIPGAGQIELGVKKRVFCELEQAIQFVNKNYPVKKGETPETLKPYANNPIPPDWLAQVSLSFQVDEASSLNPGASLITTLPNAVQTFGPGNTVTTPQSRSLGLGATLSSTATRVDKFNPLYSIRYLMTPEGPNSMCRPGYDPLAEMGFARSSPFILEGDLGIRQWLEGAVITDVLIASEPGPKSSSGTGGGLKTDAYSYEVKFVIVTSGNITPTWKLVQVTGNTAGPFFSTGRTRTHDLIITIGPNDTRSLNAHLAAEIGQAVSGANGSRLAPPN